MKLLVFLLLFLCSFSAFSQTTTTNDFIVARKGFTLSTVKIDSIQKTIDFQEDTKVPTSKAVRDYFNNKLVPIGGIITTIPSVGTIVSPNLSPSAWILETFYGAQPPLSTLSGGSILEYTIGSAISKTLTWSASRQSATNNILSIVVGGFSQSFTNPAQPGTVSGTQVVSVPLNTTTTFTNLVTASGGKNASSTTTFTYGQKYYIGYVSTNSPSDANIISAIGSSTFATTFVTSGTLAAPPSSSYIIFAFPASFGTAIVKINGLAVGYTLITRSFVNASGYTSSYNIYISPFATSGGVDYQIL